MAKLESYSDSSHTTVCNAFSGSNNTVYMHGSGFDNSTAYHVAYYDADGTKQASDGKTSDSNGNLNSACILNTNPNAAPGTWHAVVYKDSEGSPPDSYNPDDSNIVLKDEFTVESSAIPEFPAVIASIIVTGMCAGIYYCLKKRNILKPQA